MSCSLWQKAHKAVGKKIIVGNQGADEVRSECGFGFCLTASTYSIQAQLHKQSRQSHVTDYCDCSSSASIFGKQEQPLVHTKYVFSLTMLHLFVLFAPTRVGVSIPHKRVLEWLPPEQAPSFGTVHRQTGTYTNVTYSSSSASCPRPTAKPPPHHRFITLLSPLPLCTA